jgi:hypothetical protein
MNYFSNETSFEGPNECKFEEGGEGRRRMTFSGVEVVLE